MQTASIKYRSSQISYSYGGSGEKLLVCLHGYGESEKSYHFLEPHLPAGYRMLAIDLPFHGGTEWKEGLTFTTEDLLSIIDHICKLHTGYTGRLTLAGFSMGGRVALGLMEKIPAQTDKVILLAPDGLKVNIWYRLATRTLIGNRFFRFTMRHPQWFMLLLRIGNRLGLINQSVLKFTRYYIHDKQVREDLYNRWTCMRYIRPHLPAIKKSIVQYAIPFRLVYGQYDRIIRHERGEKFRTGIESFCTLRIIPTGHQLLQEKNVEVILELLQS
jgi:pimeloyl-ACP methyl ester carboxylesterase